MVQPGRFGVPRHGTSCSSGPVSMSELDPAYRNAEEEKAQPQSGLGGGFGKRLLSYRSRPSGWSIAWWGKTIDPASNDRFIPSRLQLCCTPPLWLSRSADDATACPAVLAGDNVKSAELSAIPKGNVPALTWLVTTAAGAARMASSSVQYAADTAACSATV
jgi:hypothetical protein